MMRTIEADFFPPAVEEFKDMPHALIIDNDPDAAHSVEPSPTKPTGFYNSDGSNAQASPKGT